MKWRACALLALPWGLALADPAAAPTTTAPAASAAADADLLEFLGSVDSDEAGWHDYLAQTDLEKVIRARAKLAPQSNQGKDK